MLAHGDARGAANGGAGLAGDDERASQAAGGAGLRPRRDDLDLVPVVQLRHQRRDLAVDLAADRHVADIGMHRIGEVDRRRAWRGSANELALRREAEHLIVEQFELGVLEKLLRRSSPRPAARWCAAATHRRWTSARQQLGRRALRRPS